MTSTFFRNSGYGSKDGTYPQLWKWHKDARPVWQMMLRWMRCLLTMLLPWQPVGCQTSLIVHFLSDLKNNYQQNDKYNRNKNSIPPTWRSFVLYKLFNTAYRYRFNGKISLYFISELLLYRRWRSLDSLTMLFVNMCHYWVKRPCHSVNSLIPKWSWVYPRGALIFFFWWVCAGRVFKSKV